MIHPSPKHAALLATRWTAAAFLFVLFLLPCQLRAQQEELTVVVLINSQNTVEYNTNPGTPGTYQMGPERYLVHLQVPYRIIDVSSTPAVDLSAVQLVIAGHKGLSPSGAWQTAIAQAVASGVGFVNFDNDPSIGTQSHIQQIFKAAGSTVGSDQTSIVIPAAVQVGGATPHYITALQRHWTDDPAGDLIYTYHGNGQVVIPTDATILTGANGTVVAKLGTDPLILATSYNKGRAVDFTSYEYMHPDRFGFVMGVDDLFWRSIVWAARKPFVLRGYPRLSAIQLDDNEIGIMSRIPDLWNQTLTGPLASDGTGGPWNPQINMQLDSLADPGGERAQLITAIQANQVHASPHGLEYGSGGDLYWNLTVPNTDAQWQTNVNSALQWQAGQGGSDTFPKFSTSMVAHYWDISNNAGYEMWNSLGLRYITSPQAPGIYYFATKTPAMRIPLGPFRIYEQPPIYTGDLEETFPFFYADDLTVGSVAGKPPQTFFSFASQVGQSAGRFSRPDAVFPSTQNSYTLAQSLNQWKYYMWRFWSGMAPVQIYTHDGNNLDQTSASDRQAFITQLSQWFGANHGTHLFMDNMGDYLRARNHSLLTSATLTNSALTLNFTGSSTDADGHLIPTQFYEFYGDDEGTLLNVPGFTSGGSYLYPNTQPASMQLLPLNLSFATLPGATPAAKTVAVSNIGAGSFPWTVSSSASWLSASAPGGVSGTSITVTANSATLPAGTYNGTLTFTASAALNSPQTIPVTLVISTAGLVPSAASLDFRSTVGGAAPQPATVTVTNPSGTSLAYTVSSDSSWLGATIITPGTPGAIVVSVTPGSLPLGIYTGNITLTPPQGQAFLVTIPVTFEQSGVIASPSTASLNDWTLSPLGSASFWTSTGGSILFSGNAESQLYAGSMLWNDYDLDVNLTLANLNDYPGGFRVRVDPSTGSGYALWMYPSERSLALYKVVNWNISNGYTLIGSASNIAFSTAPHIVRIGAHGSQITASFDGVVVITATDSTYTSGVIALDPSGQPVAYNAVTVSSTSNPVTSFSAAPTSLSFSALVGAASATPQTVALTSTSASLTWTSATTVPWLTVTPAQGGSTPASPVITATAAGLTAGVYSAVVTFSSSAGISSTVSVLFTVTGPSNQLQVAPASANLQTLPGQPATVFNVGVSSLAAGAFNWTATSNQPWLTLAPASGAASGTIAATASSTSLPPGSYSAIITVTAPGLSGSPFAVPVSLSVVTATLADSFSNNAVGWIISPNGLGANFSVANQTYSYSGGGNTQSCSGSSTYSDYEFDFGLRLANLGETPGGVRARVNPLSGAGYGLWLYPASGVVKLLRFASWSDSNPTLITQAPLVPDLAAHAYRFVFLGSAISAYQDNTLLLSATDTTNNKGYVCFDTSTQPVSYTQAMVISGSPGAALTASVSALSFSAPGGTPPAPRSFTLTSSVPVTYGVVSSAPWLLATISNSTTAATITVTATGTSLANGTYSASLTIYSPGSSNAPLVVPVTLAVSSAVLAVKPAKFDLFSPAGTSPAAVTVAITNTGSGTLPWTATSNSNWLIPSPASSPAAGTLTLTPATSSLPSGTTIATVTVASFPGANGTALIPVTLHLGTQIFSDTFPSNSLQWKPSPLGRAANWSVVSNSFRYNGKGHTQQYAGSQTWANYIVSAAVTLSNLSDYPGGLRGRVNLTTGVSYAAWLYPAEHVIKLYRTTGWNIDSSGLTLLGTSASVIFDKLPHNLRLGFSGTAITVYYDNAQIITATDNKLAAGAIALDVSSQPVNFSNVSVLQ